MQRKLQTESKSYIFWGITPCSMLKVNQCFRGTCRLHLHSQRIGQARNQHESRAATSFHTGFLLSLYFNHENWGGMSLRNVSWCSMDYAVLYPRRQNSSYPPLWEPQILYRQNRFIKISNKSFEYVTLFKYFNQWWQINIMLMEKLEQIAFGKCMPIFIAESFVFPYPI
jgi:hypothetical protein